MFVKVTAHHKIARRTREILSLIPSDAWKSIDPQLLVYDILAYAVGLDEATLLDAVGPETYIKVNGRQQEITVKETEKTELAVK